MWRPRLNARYYCHSYECDACEHSSFKCGCFHPTITVLHIVFLAHGIVNDDINNLTIIWCMLITTMSCIFHYHWTLISTQHFHLPQNWQALHRHGSGLNCSNYPHNFLCPHTLSFLSWVSLVLWMERTHSTRQSHNSAFVNTWMNREDPSLFPRPTLLLHSFVCVDNNTQKWKSSEKCALLLPCIIFNANQRMKNGVGVGTRLCIP